MFFLESINLLMLFALLFFTFTTFYAFLNSHFKQKYGLIYFFVGFVFGVMAFLLQHNIPYFYAKGISIKLLIFVELLCISISSLFFIISAYYILFNKFIGNIPIFLITSCEFILCFYSIFIADDSHMVASIKQIFPLLSLSFVFLSYITVSKVWLKLGRLLASISILSYLFILTYSLFFGHTHLWNFSIMATFMLGFSYIMMLIDDLNHDFKIIKKNQAKSTKNLNSIITSSPFPIILSRLGDDSLIMVNKNALKLFGLDATEINRYHFKDFFVDADNRKLLTERLEHNQEVQDFEILVKTATGNTPFWLLLSANIIEYNNDIVIYSAFQDITLRKRHESVLQSQADRDPLTSIYNRRYFETTVEQKIKNAHSKNIPFAIFMIDADKFKNINDKYGHKIGDKVLIELAAICEKSLRPEDIVARYGGEEFVAFVDNVEADTAIMVANRLRKLISESVVYSDNNEPVCFSVSIGVVPSGISDNVSVMIKMADDAMYLAKQNGRNRVELYNKDNLEQLSSQESRAKKSQIHPAFSLEGSKEISLLDGVETTSIIED